MKHLVNSYADWIREGLSLREVGNGWHEIVTPFLNHRNDMIELYIRQDGDRITLSDGGNTLNELSLSGLDIDRSKKRSEELNYILRSFGVQKNEKKEIFMTTDVKRFPEVKHRMIQAILAIDDLCMLTEPKVESFFIEDILNFLELNDIVYVKDTLFTGKSGFTHKFDFTLPKIRDRKEIAVKAINKPKKDSIGGVIWMIEDTRNARQNTNGLVILNDSTDVTADIPEALNQYGVPYFLWSRRNDNIDNLKALRA